MKWCETIISFGILDFWVFFGGADSETPLLQYFLPLPLDPNSVTLFTHGWSSKFREKCENSDWNHRNHWTRVDNPLLIHILNIINQHQCNDVPTTIRLSDGKGGAVGVLGRGAVGIWGAGDGDNIFSISCSFGGRNCQNNRFSSPFFGLAAPLANPGSDTGMFRQWQQREQQWLPMVRVHWNIANVTKNILLLMFTAS